MKRYIPVLAVIAVLLCIGARWSDDRFVSGSSSTEVKKYFSTTASLDFDQAGTALATGCSTDLTVSVTGAAVGDLVAIGVPNGSVNPDSMFMGWVSSTNNVTVRHCTITIGANNPASGTFRVSVWQH